MDKMPATQLNIRRAAAVARHKLEAKRDKAAVQQIFSLVDRELLVAFWLETLRSQNIRIASESAALAFLHARADTVRVLHPKQTTITAARVLQQWVGDFDLLHNGALSKRARDEAQSRLIPDP